MAPIHGPLTVVTDRILVLNLLNLYTLMFSLFDRVDKMVMN